MAQNLKSPGREKCVVSRSLDIKFLRPNQSLYACNNTVRFSQILYNSESDLPVLHSKNQCTYAYGQDQISLRDFAPFALQFLSTVCILFYPISQSLELLACTILRSDDTQMRASSFTLSKAKQGVNHCFPAITSGWNKNHSSYSGVAREMSIAFTVSMEDPRSPPALVTSPHAEAQSVFSENNTADSAALNTQCTENELVIPLSPAPGVAHSQSMASGPQRAQHTTIAHGSNYEISNKIVRDLTGKREYKNGLIIGSALPATHPL